MKHTEPGDKSTRTCPTCGKNIPASKRRGSFTAYLFGGADCTCGQAPAAPRVQQSADGDGGEDQDDFCARCGLRIASDFQGGSFTGFLFQSTRCKCPPDQAFADGKMSDRLFKLKQAGAGTVFISASAAQAGQDTGKMKQDQLQPSLIDLAPGAIIGGAYEILKLISRGGMGEVYLAHHETLGKKCALKVILPEKVTEVGWRRFQLEAKTVAKLEHINLVRVTDLGIHEGCLPFYAMDLVEGETLADILTTAGAMPLPLVLDTFMQVCDGVHFAHHHGILHRDLKPGNLMLMPLRGGKRLVKILDFGLAKLTTHDREKQSLTAVGDVFGTPYYMSPEQLNGEKVDRRSDIYSIGCTMFECLTNRPPFCGNLQAAIKFGHLGQDPPSLESIVGRGKYPNSMEVIIAKLLRKNPVERYQNFLELRGDLEKVSRGEDVEPFYVSRSKLQAERGAPATGASEEPEPSLRFGRAGAIIATMAVVAALALTGKALLSNLHPGAPPTSLTTQQPPGADKPTQNGGTHSPPAGLVAAPYKMNEAPASSQDTTPYSSIVVEYGQKWRLFRFPEDTSIGEMWPTSDPNKAPQQATGQLKFPADRLLTYRPYPIVLGHNNYLTRFRPGDIFEILLTTRSANKTAISADVAEDYLQATAVVPANSLVLQFNSGDLSLESLHLIEKFQSIKYLNTGEAVPPNMLAHLATIGQLRDIGTQGADVSELVMRLKNSPTVRKLRLGDAKLSLADIANLTTMPNLELLHIKQVKPSNTSSTVQALNLLSKLPHLHKLIISSLPVTSESLKVLQSFKGLLECQVDADESGIHDEDRLPLLREAARLHLPLRFTY